MSMSRATRLIVVAHLAARRMPVQEIADELGVSRETVRRDLRDTAPPDEPEPAPDEAPDVAPPVAAPEPGLHLPDHPQLRQDIRLLADEYTARPEDVARFAIHQLAQAVRAHRTARLAAAPAGRSA